MSYISKINLNNVQYDIKDAAAQSALSVLNGDSTVVGSVAYAAYWTESDADKKLAADIASLTGGAGSIAQQIQAALDELDSTSSGSGSVVTAVTQTDGQVAAGQFQAVVAIDFHPLVVSAQVNHFIFPITAVGHQFGVTHDMRHDIMP